MTPISLVLITDTYPPVIGGSEVEAQRVAAGLRARGHQVEVWTSGGSPMPELWEWVDPAGVPVRILTRRSRGFWKYVLFGLQVAWQLFRRRDDYQLVYFLMQGFHLAAGLPVARLLGKPIVMKFGGSGVIPLMQRSRLGRLELHWLNRWAERLMILNEGMMQEALAYGFQREQMLWMPNPVDTEAFRNGAPEEIDALRARFGLPAGLPVAVYVGRLSPEKGLRWLLEGFGHASKDVPEAVLLLVGDGPLRKELEEKAVALGLSPSQIRFAGRVPVAEVALWLRASDVFCLVSPSEGFSCALAEAMAAGLSSVVSDIPANAQLVDSGAHGLAIPVGNTVEIGKALARLFQDRPLRERMGEAARRRICDNYSLVQVVQLYEDLFAEILRKR
jgi:glycosyltransferase involved in cell wall biosynthesis